MAYIMDNLIAEGRIEPTIVVTPNGSDFPNQTYRWDRAAITDYVVNTLLPYMAENYNASSDPSRRALAGLSQGGATVGYLLFNSTDTFDYYCLFSAPFMGDAYPDYNKPELKDKTIFMGYGDYDFVVTRSLYHMLPDADGKLQKLISNVNEGSTLEYFNGLTKAGVEYTSLNLPYGHQWTLWRQLLVHICDEVLWK